MLKKHTKHFSGCPILCSLLLCFAGGWLMTMTAAGAVPCLHAEALVPQKLRYAEKSRRGVVHTSYEMTKTPGGCTIVLSSNGIIQEIESDSSLHTVQERYRDAACTMTVSRQGEYLVFTGRDHNRPVQHRIRIGNDIWYGSKLLLGGFAVSSEKSQAFYMTRPEDRKAVRLLAVKEGDETVTVCGRPTAAVKVKLTMPDARSFFWKSYFWYRKADGVLVKSEETRGMPWEGTTMVELIHEEVRQ